NDDIDYDGGMYTSMVTVSLEADEVVYVFVDGYFNGSEGWAGPYTLTASTVSLPVLESVEGFFYDGILGLRGAGVSEDPVYGFMLDVLDADGASLFEQVIEAGFDEVSFASFEQGEDGSFTFEIAGGLGDDAVATQALVAIYNDMGYGSEVMTVELGTPPEVAVEAECEYGFNSCADGARCLPPLDADMEDPDLAWFCRMTYAPTVTGVELFSDGETSALRVMGTDQDMNTSGLYLKLLNEADETLAEGEGGFNQISWAEDVYTGVIYLDGPFPEDLVTLQIKAIDDDGEESELFEMAVTAEDISAATEAAEGEPCDEVRVVSACVDGFFCTDGVCAADAPCPEAWGAEYPSLSDAEGWMISGDTTGSEIDSLGTCGGGSGAAIYTFTAAEAGVYLFSTTAPEAAPCAERGVACEDGTTCDFGSMGDTACASDEECGENEACMDTGFFGAYCTALICGGSADTVLYGRYVCNSGDVANEVCNDDADGLLSTIAMEIDAEQSVYLFVDGYDWQGNYGLKAEMASAPEISTAEVYYNAETGLTGVMITGDDVNNDIVGFHFELLDADNNAIDLGEDVLFIERSFNTVDPEIEGFAGRASFTINTGIQPAHAVVRLMDASELMSEALEVTPMMPEMLEEGAACDPEMAAFAFCAGESLCIGGEAPVCTVLQTECPATIPVEPFATEGSSPWSVEGEVGADAAMIDPSCGSESPYSGYAFTAPAAGDYWVHLEPVGEGFDTVLSARHYCGETNRDLACNDDGVDAAGEDLDLRSGLSLTLEEGEIVYLFVTGYSGALGGFTMIITAL
ncbi:hypothetical protein KKF91_20705, partial [Myxococcota bacterium]|nr:hypothetical protein [Myxococcota bacterium]